MPAYPRVVPFGEGAVLVELGDAPDRALNAATHALSRALEMDPPPGLRALVPGYVSVLVVVDPRPQDVTSHVSRVLAGLVASSGSSTGRLRTIPVVYGGEHGPDLDDVAGRVHLTARQVIAEHGRDEQIVYMLGFAPGHPYIGDLPSEFAGVPRLESPRTRVPRGAVGVVGRQTVIYPHSSPGGWRIIGQTPIELWDQRRDPPAYFAPGDRVQFVSIDARDWQDHAGTPADW